MTYKESYMRAHDIGELKGMVEHDAKLAVIFGGNPDRIKAIEDAMNEVVKKKRWEDEA